MVEMAVDKEFIAALMLWHPNKMLTYNAKRQKVPYLKAKFANVEYIKCRICQQAFLLCPFNATNLLHANRIDQQAFFFVFKKYIVVFRNTYV